MNVRARRIERLSFFIAEAASLGEFVRGEELGVVGKECKRVVVDEKVERFRDILLRAARLRHRRKATSNVELYPPSLSIRTWPPCRATIL